METLFLNVNSSVGKTVEFKNFPFMEAVDELSNKTNIICNKCNSTYCFDNRELLMETTFDLHI